MSVEQKEWQSIRKDSLVYQQNRSILADAARIHWWYDWTKDKELTVTFQPVWGFDIIYYFANPVQL